MNEKWSMIESYKRINKSRKNTIKRLPRLITMDGKTIAYQNSLTLIQGKMGCHKSRLAELMMSCILGKSKQTNDYMKLDSKLVEFKMMYIDTERSEYSQLPHAINRIFTFAGLEEDKLLWNVKYSSLTQVSPKKRSVALKRVFKHYVRGHESMHYIFFLDVMSDCVEDFNSSKESQGFISRLNKLISKYNCSIICILHENPSSLSDKPRGHLGTEVQNKATTVLRMVKNSSGIKLVKRKARFENSGTIFLLEFDEMEKCLKLKEIKEGYSFDVNEINGSADDIQSFLVKEFNGVEYYKPEFIDIIKNKFGIGQRTIESRIKILLDSPKPMIDENGDQFKLRVKKDGNKNVYYLEEV